MPDVMVERRAAPRYPLILAAVVAELPHGTKLAARSSDISRTGCYIDTLNPIPAGRQIQIRLSNAGESFEARGRVVYVSPSLGMGVAFESIAAEQLAILDRWLEEAAQGVHE
jgi:hypothetical protein